MKASELIKQSGGAWPTGTKRRAVKQQAPRPRPKLPQWTMTEAERAIHDECEQSVFYLGEMACELIENGEGCACRSAFLRACQTGNYPAACPHREELLRLRMRDGEKADVRGKSGSNEGELADPMLGS